MTGNMKMLLLARGNKGDRRYDNGRYEMPDYGRDEYWPEGRFRDNRGREHYDNGRYAPTRNDGGGIFWTRDRRDYGRNNYDEMRYREGQEPMGRIGFDTEMNQPQEYRTDYRMDGGYHMDEPERHDRHMQRGYADNWERPMSRAQAQEWARSMENEDGTHGPHWTMEQAKQVMAQKGVECDPQDFWLALNMIYSDYCRVFRKYGVGDKIDLYVDMAKAFLDDKDAVTDKLAKYYEYIVRH